MARIQTHTEVNLDAPVLVEGLPGVGLVGKLAADHLVEELDMTYYASCHCEGLPRVAVYETGSPAVRPPVRIYADEERDLLVLQADVPVSPRVATEFASCVTGWLVDNDVTPVYLSGLAEKKEDVPEMYGIATGDGEGLLADCGIDTPTENGVVSGPTGALLAEAGEQDIDGVGLVVQSNPNFPDPEAARVLLTKGIEPLASIEVDTEKLVEQADKVAEARERLAKQMQEASEESTRAQPVGMYQ